MLFLKGVGSLAGLFLFQLLISSVMEKNLNFQYLYFLALLTGLVWFFTRCAELNTYHFVDVFYQAQRQVLIMIIYERVSKVSEFVIKSKEVSKIYNLITSDFNITESYVHVAFFLLSIPLEFIGIICLISVKIGWSCIIVGIIVLIPIPIQMCLGKVKASYLKEANEFKDSRIKIYSEIVDGIKFIKMYGWEIAFKHIIQDFRSKEISKYIYLYFFSGLSKAISLMSLYLAIYFTFFYEYKEGTLTSSKIVSILPTIMWLKKFAQYLTYGCDSYYFFLSVFERYSLILNLKDIRMINLDNN